MYIAPDTEIRVLKNVPLDNTYEHTIGWTERTQQMDYFKSKTKFTFSKQTYQRLQRGKMRVEKPAESLYDCNYLMYQNTAFGTKWFYAFITGVEYVNNITSEITFEIDPLNTWFFDWSFGDCFVEREHSITDNPGDNLLPENLELGEYIGDAISNTGVMRDWVIVMAKTANVIGVPATGGFYGRTFHQCEFKVYEPNASGIADLHTDIAALSIFDNVNTILDLFMMPRELVYTKAGALGDVQPITAYITKTKDVTSLGSYTPKNKKLLTYPYNFLRVSNMQGITNDYKYEYFSSNDCQFLLGADTTINPTIIMMPDYYKGLNTTDPLERITLGDFPKCSFTTNDFGAKLVQAAIKTAIVAGTGSAAPAVTSKLTTYEEQVRNPKSGRLITTAKSRKEITSEHQPREDSPFSRVASSVAQATSGSHVNNICGDGSAMYNLGYFDFMFRHMYIRPEIARCIDDYFSMFGYQTNRLKKPNWNSRPHWNYVKTADCVIVGGVPADDMNRICKIHNAGITYWKNPVEVGNYNLDNSPT